MIKFLGRMLLTALAAFSSLCAVAEGQSWEERKKEALPEGMILDAAYRARYEFVDWFGPEGADTDYEFPQSKLQLGLGYQRPEFKFYLQGQSFQLWDLPRAGTGPGATYFSTNEGDTTPGGVFIRQLFAEIRDFESSGVTAQVGRFLYTGGLETTSADPALAWLKSRRIGHRLIGPFDFTGGRSFDGVRGDFKSDDGRTVTAHYSHPTQGGFETNGSDGIEDIDLATAAYTAPLAEKGEAQLFYYYYGDGRNVVKADNRPDAERSTDFQDISLSTLGGHWVQLWEGPDHTIDTLLWGAAQFGEWGRQDHAAASVAVEAGYRWTTLYGKPWIRAGYTLGTGDDDPDDSDHTTFFQILPTARIYAQTPFYNMQNTHDLMTQVLWDPLEVLTLRSDVHVLWLTNDEDLLYSGAGANEARSRFGYSGISSQGEQYIGTLFDIEATWKMTSQLSLVLYYGHLFGGDVTEASYSDDDIDYGFIELNVKL